jgi:hypothetical protein
MTYNEHHKNGFRGATTHAYDYPSWPLSPIDSQKKRGTKEKDHMQHQFVGGKLVDATSYQNQFPIPALPRQDQAVTHKHKLIDLGYIDKNTTTKLDYPRWESYKSTRSTEKKCRERELLREDRSFDTTTRNAYPHPRVQFGAGR